MDTDTEVEVCSICFGRFKLCVVLACQHKFCLLCIKEFKLRTPDACCPHCRSAIPSNFFDSLSRDFSNYFNHQQQYSRWAYRSRTQPTEWWLYDDDSNDQLTKGQADSVKVLTILGEPYTINFQRGLQISHDGLRMRPIKQIVSMGRNMWNSGAVGIAGIRHVLPGASEH